MLAESGGLFYLLKGGAGRERYWPLGIHSVANQKLVVVRLHAAQVASRNQTGHSFQGKTSFAAVKNHGLPGQRETGAIKIHDL